MNLRFASAFETLPQGVPAAWQRLSPRTRRIGWIALALLAALAAWLLFGISGGGPKAPPPVPVRYGTVKLAPVKVINHTIGTVVANDMVNVNARVEGEIVEIGFKEGQMVHKGDLLFQLDPRPFVAALEQSRAQLAKDQAQYVSAHNDQVRYDALFAANATSSEQRDVADAAAKSDAATVQADSAAVKTAALNLAYAHIVSPIDGKTGPILVQNGNMVTANTATPLVTITQIQPVKVSFFLPQSDLPQIQNQMAAGKLYAIVPMPGAEGGQEVAKVDFIGNMVSAQTGTIELRATFPNSDQRLVPGQTVDVGATMNELPQALVVPHNAVNIGPDGAYLYVVTRAGKADLVPVAVLYDDGTNETVKGKLKPGDKVVTEGQLRLTSGMAVNAKPGAGIDLQIPPGAQ
jgi:multidrug efflux system membrane fusion protein